MPDDRASAIRDDNPFASWPPDKPVPVRRIDFAAVEGAGAAVSNLANWGYFEGAVLSLGLQSSTEEGLRLEGSAVMIAPGLALTASHVFLDEYEDLLKSAQSMALLGVRSDGTADAWKVEHIVHAKNDDMALLSVSLMSRVHPDWYVSTMSLTTRTPSEGETVTLIGFREDAEQRLVEMGDVVTQSNVGDMLVAQGEVGTIYDEGRDSVFLPFPTFEVRCGALPGMSGGAVLDERGKLLGVISTSFTTEAADGPTFATRVTELLGREVRLSWSPFRRDEPTPLHALSTELLDLEGRSRLHLVDGQLSYDVWT